MVHELLRVEIGEVTPLPLYPRSAEGALATAEVALRSLTRPGEVELSAVWLGVRHRLGTFAVDECGRRCVVTLPELPHETPVLVEACEPGGECLARRGIVWSPATKWVVHAVHHSHIDLGYTGHQPSVILTHASGIDKAMALAEETAGYPTESQFRYTIEQSWAVEEYLAVATPSQRAALLEAVRTGRIWVARSYLNMLYSLCEKEELTDLAARATSISEEVGSDSRTALLTDVPGVPWAAIDAFWEQGVRNLDLAPNDMRLTTAMGRPSLFWWEGPSGSSRVLTYVRTDPPVYTYYEGNHLGLLEGVATLADRLSGRLTQLTELGYEFPVYGVRVQGVHPHHPDRYIDNTVPDRRLAEVVKAWNEVYAHPQIRISTPDAFFDDVKAHEAAARLPVVRGELTDWWTDGAASSTRETGLARVAGARLATAALLARSAGCEPRDAPAIDTPDALTLEATLGAAKRDLLLYHEHTWGSDSADLTDPMVAAQWEWKKATADRAASGVEGVMRAAAAQLCGARCDPLLITVVNGLGSARSDIARVPLACLAAAAEALAAGGGQVADSATGNRVASQVVTSIDGTPELVFIAEAVPAFGCRVYRVELGPGASPITPGGAPVPDPVAATWPQHRLIADLEAGVVNVLDRVSHRTLAAPGGPGLNRFEYALQHGDEAPTTFGLTGVRVTEEAHGSVCSYITLEGAAPNSPRVRLRTTVYSGLDRVDFDDIIMKAPTRNLERLYIVFGPDIAAAGMRYGLQGCETRLWADQLPGSSLNLQTVGDYVCLEGASASTGAMARAAISSAQCPLVSWGTTFAASREEVRTGSLAEMRGPTDAAPDLSARASVLSFLACYNGWTVNYRPEQEGELRLSFSLARAGDPAVFGEAFRRPLYVHTGGAPKGDISVLQS